MGGRRVGVPGGGPPRTPKKFSKHVKKSIENLKFLKNFQEYLAICSKIHLNFIEFLAKIWTKI